MRGYGGCVYVKNFVGIWVGVGLQIDFWVGFLCVLDFQGVGGGRCSLVLVVWLNCNGEGGGDGGGECVSYGGCFCCVLVQGSSWCSFFVS